MPERSNLAELEAWRYRAERRFLGRLHVVGVGIADDHTAPHLAFLLDGDSPEAADAIRSWARRAGVAFDIEVSGPIRLVSD